MYDSRGQFNNFWLEMVKNKVCSIISGFFLDISASVVGLAMAYVVEGNSFKLLYYVSQWSKIILNVF